MSRKLKVHVVAGKGLMAKAKTTSSAYVEVSELCDSVVCWDAHVALQVTVFDEKGQKACPPQTTKVVKEDLNPKWDTPLTL